MKRLGWLVVLIASLPALACADDVDFVPRWKMPKSGVKYVKIEGDRLVVDVPAGISNVCAYATAEIDLSGWAQRSFEAEVRCRGERLVRDSRRDRGVKLSLHYEDTSGIMQYPCAPAPEEGDFGWTNLRMSVTFGAVPCAKSSRPKVVLGLQQTSGRIEFDLSSLRLRNTPLPYPVADNDYQVQYPPEIASRGRMRGVMGRGVGKNKERDIDDLKNYGANLIRLQMNGFALKRPLRSGEKPKTLADWNKWLARCLDDAERVLGMLEERGMMMVLDMHNTPLGGYGTFADAFYVQENADRFVEAWREIAIRFKGRKGIYGYDLMNEPAQSRRALQGCDYWNLQRRAAEAIREVDPDATIVFAANDWSAPEAFEYLVALDMDNVVYEVHMYRPNRYTHQGANGRARPQPGTEIPYPDPKRGVDKTRLREYLKPVRDFQKRHGAKIYVGEFSACIYAPGAGRYLRDCISIFEEYGWDWTYHSFREALWWNVETVIDPKTGKPVPDKDNDRFRALVDGFNFGKQGYDVYLLIGQSNMSGRGTLTADNAVSNDRIVKFTKDMKWAPADEPLHFDRKHCGAGLAMSFARKMADASPERTVALVPCAVGGTPLRRWCPGGDLYSNAVVRARAALRDGTLKGILWHQGCADANNITNAETYAARLVPMVAQLRRDLGAEDVPFVAGELPRFLSRYAEKNGHHHHWPVVNAQLAEAVSRIPNAALVSSEGLEDCRDDLIHFETPSLRRFGERYAEAMLKVQGEGTAGNGANAELRPFAVVAETLDPKGGHVQGIAAGEESLYVAQMTRLVKVDWKGNVLAQRTVQSHTGDITWHDGELYTAVAVYPECKEGRIQVFDKDLNLVRETVVDRAIDGIAYADGVLYVGMGAKEQPSSKPHRVNIIGRFDAKTLREIAPRAEFDYGYETKYGFQNIVFDGARFIASFYAVKGSPEVAFFDKDLKILGTAFAKCNQGFDILPPSMRGSGLRFVRAKTKAGESGVSCSFDFIDLGKWCHD